MAFAPEFVAVLRLVFMGMGLVAIVTGLAPVARDFIAWLEKLVDRKQ